MFLPHKAGLHLCFSQTSFVSTLDAFQAFNSSPKLIVWEQKNSCFFSSTQLLFSINYKSINSVRNNKGRKQRSSGDQQSFKLVWMEKSLKILFFPFEKKANYNEKFHVNSFLVNITVICTIEVKSTRKSMMEKHKGKKGLRMKMLLRLASVHFEERKTFSMIQSVVMEAVKEVGEGKSSTIPPLASIIFPPLNISIPSLTRVECVSQWIQFKVEHQQNIFPQPPTHSINYSASFACKWL